MPLLLLISTSHTSHEILSDVRILSLRASLENTTEEGVPELTFGLGPTARHQEYVEVVNGSAPTESTGRQKVV